MGTMDPDALGDALRCRCPGTTFLRMPCIEAATQEDFLCNHCRQMDCRTVTRENEAERRAAHHPCSECDDIRRRYDGVPF